MILSIAPVTGSSDPMPLVVGELDAGQILHTSFTAIDQRGRSFTTTCSFAAHDDGTVDTSTHLPREATWQPADSRGPIWTMQADDLDIDVFDADPQAAISVEIKVRTTGESGKGTAIQRVIGRHAVEVDGPTRPKDALPIKPNPGRDAFLPDPFDFTPFHGRFFLPDSRDVSPLVILLPAFDGAHAAAGAAALAQHGFAVAAPVLTGGDVALADLEQLLQRLTTHPNVDASCDVTLIAQGPSTETALALAHANPLKVGPLILHSPSGVLTALSTGQPTVVGEVLRHTEFLGGGGGSLTDKLFHRHPDYDPDTWYKELFAHATDEEKRAAALPLSGLRGPVLITDSGADELWPGRMLADDLAARFASEATEGCEVFVFHYPGAGHGTGYPFTITGYPQCTVVPFRGHVVHLGGSQSSRGAAAFDSEQQVTSLLTSFYS